MLSAALVLIMSNAAAGGETRQLDAHEHGVGQLDIAFEGDRIVMELRVPGADIVGFEYLARSAEDRATVDAAVAALAQPLALFVLPQAAGCSVQQASASVESDAPHDDHAGHDDHAHGHSDHGHAEHDHDHSQTTTHSEFHASYALTCISPMEATEIDFAYFTAFPRARALEVQVVSERAATAFEVERTAPALDLRTMF